MRTALASLSMSLMLTFAAAGAEAAERVLVVTDTAALRADDVLVVEALRQALEANGQMVVWPQKPARGEARAARDGQSAEALRASGRKQFDFLELDKAVRDYSKALQKFDRAVLFSRDVSPIVDTLSMLGATLLLVGQEQRARPLLERLFVLEPSFAPPQAIFNPQMLATVEALASDVRGRAPQTITIQTEPAGAAVYLDGRFVGTSPARVDALPGRHYVHVTRPGFDPNGRAIDSSRPHQSVVSLKLTKAKPVPKHQQWIKALLAAPDTADVSKLAKAYKASSVAVLNRQDGGYTLARHTVDGSPVQLTSSTHLASDLAQAQHIAEELLGQGSHHDGDASPSQPAVAANSQVPPAGDDGPVPSSAEPPPPISQPTVVAAAEPTSPSRTVEQIDAAPTTATSAHLSTTLADSYWFSPHPAKEVSLFVAYGVTVGAALAGGAFSYLAWKANQDYHAFEVSGGQLDHAKTTDQREGASIAASGKQHSLIADVAWGVAAVALTTGLLMQLLWDPEPSLSGDGLTLSGTASGWVLSF